MKTIFSPANILVPKFSRNSKLMEKWSIIACDQFTSEPDYWDRCRNLIGNADTTYNYIMPEAYLGTDNEKLHSAVISSSMKSFDEKKMSCIDGFIYVERLLPNGKIRHGIVGKIDLERYDYSKDSTSAVRATEKTVIERIPPRRIIRESATVEFPHILVLIDDKSGIFDALAGMKSNENCIYDFDLMQDGGHITGYAVTGDALYSVLGRIYANESENQALSYAVGDGNHSLAAAKAHWEKVKATCGDAEHPARYALCEVTAIADKSLEFEPIYRVVKNCDVQDFLNELSEICSESGGGQKISVFSSESKKHLYFKTPTHSLIVGTLQNFIDGYISAHPGVECDYIHGEESLKKLSDDKNSVGFLFDGMKKEDLIPYVGENGTLPRKTFSMGEAESKRYYLESRVIIK